MKRKPKAQLFDDERRQEILDLLPVVISGIQVQVNDPGRISIFADEKFLLGLPIHICNKLNLSKGVEIDEQTLWTIESEIQRDAIRSWLLGLLAKKPYARKQLFRKCKDAQYNTDVTDDILNEFESRGWIDDYAFALSYARDKAEFQKWGPAKIRQQLLKNGINSEIAGKALKETTDKDDQLSTAHHLVGKRRLHFLRENDTQKRKKKIIDYLLRKGYDGDVIFGNIDELMNTLNS